MNATKIKSRKYQDDLVGEVQFLTELPFADPIRVCVNSPTGSGKGVMMSQLLSNGEPQIVLTHRRVLLDQLAKVLTSFDIDFGLRAAGHATNFKAPIQLAMLPTEHRRAHASDKWPRHDPCRCIHVDEIHSQKANMAEEVINNYVRHGANLVGWTATPCNIAHLCDEQIVAATIPQLIEDGHLVQPVVFGPETINMQHLERVKKQANGEFAAAELRKIWSIHTIFARVEEYYRLLNPDCATMLFAPGVAESLGFAQKFYRRGINAAHIDGRDVWLEGEFYKSDTEARQAVFDGLGSGDVKMVCNRYVLREGFDCPAVGHVILATPFGTRSAFVQSCGRSLRPYFGRERAIIQDHCGNWLRHTALDSDEPWDMGLPERIAASERVEKMQTGEEPEPICCPKCSAIRVSGDTCPVCGHRHERSVRFVRQLNGSLKMVTGKVYKPRKITPMPTDEKTWAGLYHGNMRFHPDRTFLQIYTYAAAKNNWRYMARDLPLMPKKARDWFYPVDSVDKSDLF